MVDAPTFATWLAHTKVTPDFIGDFVKAALSDPEFPQVVTGVETLHRHLNSKHADRETHDAADLAWWRYRDWCKRQRRRERRRAAKAAKQ